MKRLTFVLLMAGVLIGCTSSVDTAVTEPVVPDPTVNSAVEPDGDPTVADSVPAGGIKVDLTPDNTQIEFVGTHTKDDPDPNARHGQFTEFQGTALVEDDELKSVSLEIQTASVTTSMDKLTNHLKSPDFLDVRSHPTATFESTRIARNDDGDYIITGNFTLLGNTQEISFPARVGMAGGKLTLTSSFDIDRHEFGMTGQPNVKKIVSMKVTIGEGGSSGDQAPA